MKSFSVRTLRAICLPGLVCLLATSAMAQSPATRIVSAANAFLSTLDEKQRQGVLFAFGDEQQRKRWSNLPTGFVPRGGISLKDMAPAQRTAVMALVASVLSENGFEKVQQIMEGDEALRIDEEKNPGQSRGGGGPPPGPPPSGQPALPGPPKLSGQLFGKDLYYISILGTPSEKSPWMLQFGGHHLALNITIAGEHEILTPTLTAAQPAIYNLNGKTVRPLGKESDKALALLNTLDAQQQKRAVLTYRVADLVLGPGQDGKTIQPDGLKASEMNERQRAMLLDLISQWSGIINESAAAARMDEIKAGLDETWFAWSGPTIVVPGSNITAYYRIQGPQLVIEYAPQPLGGDPAMHVHTMYRDPTNDYGRKLTAK